MGKRYDEQFQLRAARQVVLQGMTYQAVSESLGPSAWSIREWVKKFRGDRVWHTHGSVLFVGCTTPSRFNKDWRYSTPAKARIPFDGKP